MYETPAPVSVLTRQQIEQRAPRNSGDLFQDMPGVFTATDRQNPGVTINIRGLQEQGRVNVMIDGARQNFQQAGHNAVSFVYFDPELIGGVVVEKGPTSTVGGAGVIGGVVSLRTLEADDILLPGKNYGIRSRITTGTNAFRYTTSQAVAARNEQFEFVAALSRKETGAYQPGQNGTLELSDRATGDVHRPGQLVRTRQAHGRPTSDQTLKARLCRTQKPFLDRSGRIHRHEPLLTRRRRPPTIPGSRPTPGSISTPRPGGHRPTIISSGLHARPTELST